MRSCKKYLNYNEQTKLLNDFCSQYPHLIDMESMGKSLESRDIWGVTITNKKSRHHGDKPAIYVDACIHGGEVTGTQVCLYLIEYLITRYGSNKRITRLLDQRTFYILPCVNPDGAEAYLNTPFDSWGNRRPYPLKENWIGLERCDINNDGHILLMRVKDEGGEWKISQNDPRLMLPRKPWEYGGEFYSIYPEGKLVGEGVDIKDFKVLPREYQLNLNRNFPAGWDIESVQPGGGKYPVSEPEAKAILDFVLSHTNIGTAQSFHTYGGVNLRPFSYQSDECFNRFDLQAYIQLADAGKVTNGYDTVSIYHGFTKDKSKPRRGTLSDWMYSHLGILPIGTELWSMARMAGVKQVGDNYYPYKDSNEEEELMVLKWNDKELEGKGFKDWESFQHPQLGAVEIGGWLEKFTRKNPPIDFLQQECHKNSMFVIYQADFLPEIKVKKTEAVKIAENIYRISLIVENNGFLPSYITQKSKEIKAAEEIEAVVEDNENIQILEGNQKEILGHLEGRIRIDNNFFFGDPSEGVPKKTKGISWIIKTNKIPGEINIDVKSEKAGRIKIKIKINN